MRLEIVGEGPVAAWIVAQLAERGHHVAWFTSDEAESLRPVLLRAPVVARLRKFLQDVDASDAFLANAPMPEAGGGALAPLYRFQFPGRESDRWVTAASLTRAFSDIARSLGATITHTPLLPEPESREENDPAVRLFDVDETRVGHWRRARAMKDSSRSKRGPASWHLTELRYASAEGEDLGACSVSVLAGCTGFLEPHPAGGFSLTLVAKSRYPIERALRSLGHRRGRAPREWKILQYMNPSAPRRDLLMRAGTSTLALEGGYPFGRSFGMLSPLFNSALSESFQQAFRLTEALTKGVSAEAWTEQERKRFAGMQARAALWDRWLASERLRGNFLALAAWLPASVRDYLKTPV